MAIYKRIVLKLSGETLSDGRACYSEERIRETARMLIALVDMGVEVGVIFGGGNIWRGRLSVDMDPVNADQIGMLATIMNALAVKDAIVGEGGSAEVFTAQEMNRFARLYTRDDALNVMKSGGVALMAGGTGNPFFTTDTASAIRAAELKADAMFKGTKEQGVMDSDPRKNPNAKLIPDISYDEAIRRELGVMDICAFQVLKEQKVQAVRVFAMDDLNNILAVAGGAPIGSTVHL